MRTAYCAGRLDWIFEEERAMSYLLLAAYPPVALSLLCAWKGVRNKVR